MAHEPIEIPPTEAPVAVATHHDAVMQMRAVRDADGLITDGVLEFANEEWRRRMAQGAPDVEGRSFRGDFPDLAGARWEMVVAALESGLPLAQVYPSPTDPEYWGEIHLTPLVGDRLLIVVREVSGINEQREALRRSEARFRSALDQSPDTVAIMRPLFGADGQLEDVEALYLNRSALDRWYDGITLEALAGKRLFELKPNIGDYLRDLYRQVVATGTPFDGLRRFDSPQGLMWARVWIALTGEGIVHTSQDMTDAVLAGEALTESLRDLEEAQWIGRVGSFEMDPDIDNFTCSNEYLRLLGFDPEKGMPSRDQRLGRVDPHESRAFLDDVQSLRQAGGGSFERLMKLLVPGGEVHHLLFRGSVVAAEDGSARVKGTAVDVSDLKLARDRAESSEERFAAVVNTVEEAIAIVRPMRTAGIIENIEVEWANAAWLRREDLVGHDPTGLRGFDLHPEFRALAPKLEEVLAGGPPHGSELRLADGRWLAVSIVRLRDRVLVASRDVTERRTAQEAEFSRLTAAVEHVSDAISITDAAGRLVYVNPAFEAISGMARETAIGQVPEIIKPTADGRMAPVEMQLRRGETWHGTVERTRPDGRLSIDETLINPVLDQDGDLTGFVAVTRDVTEARAAAARREQSDRLEAVGQLAGGIAHDFNNVLAAISGYAHFVMDAPGLGPEARADVEQILAASDRATALARQLLTFSRRQVVQPRFVDPGMAIKLLLPMLDRLIGEHIRIDTYLAADAPAILIDPGQFDQVVLNLVLNAGDAMPNGGRLELHVARIERDGRAMTRLTLVDTGVGMDENVRAHLFEPFFTTKEPGRGTGLGLATVYGIVQSVGGTIEVASQPGAGSTFTIDLPAHEEEDAAPSPLPEAPPMGNGERILVVEDDKAVRRVITRVLGSLNYRVLEAESGEAALELIHGGEPVDLLVTDVRMPGLQGPQLVNLLRLERPGLRAMFVSGMISELDDSQTVDAEVLEKPFDAPRLAMAVRRALG